MNKTEARLLLSRELNIAAARSFSELRAGIGCTEVKTILGDSGAAYQLEIEIFWDDQPQGNLRIAGAIDDGGWRAFVPLTESRLKKPDRALG